jgi:hypothetical protein
MAYKDDEKIINKWVSKKSNAQSRGLEFTLTFTSMKNLLSAKKCHYTGVPIAVNADPQKGIHKLTLDRVDSTKGYIPGNVVACADVVNSMKSVIEQNPELFKKIYGKLYAKKTL